MFFSGFPFDGMDSGAMPPHRKKKAGNNDKFYNILELSKDCTTADVKKAYKRLAIKHHPDKGGDPEKFKEVSRAYEVLSDPEKRKVYDDFGEEGLDGSFAPSDATDIFDLFFGGGGRKPRGKKKGEDIVSQIKVTLEQIYNGAMKKLAINKDTICETCQGHGGPKDLFETCRGCNGQGVKIQIRQMGPMIQQTQSVCPECGGQGQMISDTNKCKSCYGRGVKKVKKILEVPIEKGVPNQYKITFNGEADQRPNEVPGDVIFIVEQQDHDLFKRSGNDLLITHEISLYEALTGFEFTLDHLDGRNLLIKNEGEVVCPGEIKVLKDEGLPQFKTPFSYGNLYITLKVKFPVGRSFNDDEKKVLLKLFPYDKKEIRDTGSLQTCVVQDADMRELNARSERHRADHDEEHEGNKVQCKQQ
ncbi:DnaJ homolog subfamily A member 2 [Babesia microti strain RI]|uniref:DnaJ homolog subfamily A member 2 n=1 Tax=Babesia microti (strain RI) TaxID=1133968 RepID=A0A0K3AMK7_BABMR|nr:DnaJ homolog subfamily A member 2 [Babesia microti strain RI]CTQ40792.1 DnaJ homolog subfamily A member 2 [Babesia microti strain RI]|eukprot:XP_012648803.1 DnaJ homolog subfamily A member 2 [Babesia microti strain RI]